MADPSPDWNDLPLELLCKVAQSVGPGCEVMKGISRVWKAACEAAATHVCIRGSKLPLDLSQRFPSLAILDLQDCTAVTLEALNSLQDLPQLKKLKVNLVDLTVEAGPLRAEMLDILRGLSLDGLEINNEGSRGWTFERLRELRGLPLVKLEVDFKLTSPPGLAVLEGMPLASLKLCQADKFISDDGVCNGPEATKSELEVLKGLPLDSLDLGCNSLQNDFLISLRRLSLKHLGLGHSTFYEQGWWDASLEALQGASLTSLNLGERNEFTCAGLEYLPSLFLKHLGLGFSNSLPEETIAIVRGISSLASLDWGSQLDLDRHLACLQGMQLTSLDLSNGWDFTDAGLDALAGMPLVNLALFPYFSDAGLVFLQGMPLASLDLGATDITDAGLALLRGFPLSNLNLDCTSTTNAGLLHLRGMNLKILSLEDTQISGAGLRVLEGMPLERLCLRECDQIDFTEVAKAWVMCGPPVCCRWRWPKEDFAQRVQP